MKIYFKTHKLQKHCSKEQEMNRYYSKKMCEKLKQRLGELNSVETLSDVSHLPPCRCHELVNRQGVFSVDLEYPFRLLFITAHDTIETKQDGGINLHNVTEIEIISIEETHDKKNQRRG